MPPAVAPSDCQRRRLNAFGLRGGPWISSGLPSRSGRGTSGCKPSTCTACKSRTGPQRWCTGNAEQISLPAPSLCASESHRLRPPSTQGSQPTTLSDVSGPNSLKTCRRLFCSAAEEKEQAGGERHQLLSDDKSHMRTGDTVSACTNSVRTRRE